MCAHDGTVTAWLTFGWLGVHFRDPVNVLQPREEVPDRHTPGKPNQPRDFRFAYVCTHTSQSMLRECGGRETGHGAQDEIDVQNLRDFGGDVWDGHEIGHGFERRRVVECRILQHEEGRHHTEHIVAVSAGPCSRERSLGVLQRRLCAWTTVFRAQQTLRLRFCTHLEPAIVVGRELAAGTWPGRNLAAAKQDGVFFVVLWRARWQDGRFSSFRDVKL